MAHQPTDDVPRLSRRHAGGAVSARGLLFTVLGEFVRPAGGRAWTSTFIEVFTRLGVEQKTTRQALMRTADAGWLVAQRTGRRTSWQLSADATRLLTEGARRIYGFRSAQADWDGRWLLVLARAPEAERGARHLLRTRLTWAGFGSPSPGIWISTHQDRRGELDRVLHEAGRDDAQIFVAEHAGGAHLAAMVDSAWDLSAIESAYREFLDDFAASRTADPLVRVTELVHAWRRFPQLDPGLPSELLPPRWSGTAAAELFADRYARWAADARADWAAIDGGS